MSTPKKSYLGVLLRWAVVMALLLGLCMVAAWFALRSNLHLSQLAQMVRSIKPWGVLVQGLLVVSVIAWWPSIVRWGHGRGYIREHELEPVLAKRTQVGLVLLAYLLLVPIGPSSLWHWFSNFST